MSWRDRDNDSIVAHLDRSRATIPESPWTLDAMRSYFRERSAERGGGIVSVEFDRPTGIPVVTAVTKFEDLPGYVYEGTVMIPFRDACYTVTLQALERGTTGTREAVTTSVLLSLGELKVPAFVPPAKSARVEGWTSDPYDNTYAGPTQCTLSDDQRLDPLFPQHPLTKVRRWLATMPQTLSIADDVRANLSEPSSDCPATSSQTRQRMSSYALGFLYLQAGQFDLAEQFLAESIPRRDDEPVVDAPGVGRTLALLGVAREQLDRMEDALWAHSRAVHVFESIHGDTHLETIRARADLARVYAGMGRYEDAEPLLEQVIPVLERERAELELAVALNALGLVRQMQHRQTDALACFDRALEIFERLNGPDFPDCATVLRNIAKSADALGDPVRSRQAQTRAEKILQAQR